MAQAVPTVIQQITKQLQVMHQKQVHPNSHSTYTPLNFIPYGTQPLTQSLGNTMPSSQQSISSQSSFLGASSPLNTAAVTSSVKQSSAASATAS
eukprot:7786573-Ditylum_brightwellii.AAC.1